MQPTQEIKETVTCSCTRRAFSSFCGGQCPTPVMAVSEQPSLAITTRGEIHVSPQLTTHAHSSEFHSSPSNTHQVHADLWLHAETNSSILPPTLPQTVKALIRPRKSLNIHSLVQEVCPHACRHADEKVNSHAPIDSKHNTLNSKRDLPTLLKKTCNKMIISLFFFCMSASQWALSCRFCHTSFGPRAHRAALSPPDMCHYSVEKPKAVVSQSSDSQRTDTAASAFLPFLCLSSHGTVTHVNRSLCGQNLKNERLWGTSVEKAHDGRVESNACCCVSYTLHGIWMSQHNKIELWFIRRLFDTGLLRDWFSPVFPAPSSVGFAPSTHFFHPIEDANAFITAQVFCALRRCLVPPQLHPPPPVVQLVPRAFLTESNLRTLQECAERREKRCGLTQTGANAYLFHWVAMLGKATVAHTQGNGSTNQICDYPHLPSPRR